MEVTLNKNQIDHISQLITKRGVKYYDVNMEFTDHIASEVEELLNENNVEYDLAVKQVFSKYDGFHFMRIEEEKENKLRKRARKIFKKSFLQFFTFPKLIFTVSIFYGCSFLLRYFSYELLALTIVSISLLGFILVVLEKRNLLGKKSFIQLKSLMAGYFISLPFPMHLIYVKNIFKENLETSIYLQSGLLTMVVICFLIYLDIYDKYMNTLKIQYIK